MIMKKVITIKVNLCYEERIYSPFRKDYVISKTYDDVVLGHTASFVYDDDLELRSNHVVNEFCSDLARKIVECDFCRLTSFLIMTEENYKSAKLMCASKFLAFLENSISVIITNILKENLLVYETEDFSERCYYDKYYIDISTPISVTIK